MIDNTAKYLYTVYKLKSVSLAAKELYISQPALSAAIKKAEDALGAPIFNRKTLPFSLTPEGKIYMESVEKMLLLAQETAQRIRDIQQVRGGTLRIGTSTHLSFYVIPKILKVFHSAYPHVDINITVTDTDELYDLLKKETADLIFLPATTLGRVLRPSPCSRNGLLWQCQPIPPAVRIYNPTHLPMISCCPERING